MADTHPKNSIFREGGNCWQVRTASHAALLVDCANYYRALHESISKAKHSVFVLGWDIDSRIRLLRGNEEKSTKHNSFFELISWKAAQNPELQIYLNRWDYSIFMAKEREAFARRRWKKAPENVHYLLDNALPLGASHHQKVIVVDDEVAFCGGMDIALNRWDERRHMPEDESRVDPGAILHFHKPHAFEPYHDTQLVVAGPVVETFSTLVRERWHRASGDTLPPPRKLKEQAGLPPTWPASTTPHFENVRIGATLTQPEWNGLHPQYQAEKLYLDMIARAEHFIYIENQFLCRKSIAKALNKRLHEKPDLRVLMVSCYDPRGLMERKAMWHGRVIFRDILTAGGVGDRVAMAYVISRVNGAEKPVRMHSKLMVVDDKYLRVGSSNINNRSMKLDTECDLLIESTDEQTSEQIAAIRNDLIREHTGRELKTIEDLIRKGAEPERFLNYISHSRQHLQHINDEIYRHDRFTKLAKRIADPSELLVPVKLNQIIFRANFPRIAVVISVVAALGLAWKLTPLASYANPETIIPILEQIRSTPWAVPAAMAVYTIGTLAFFPHMAMTATIVIVFAPLQAFSIAMTGSLISGAIGYYLGKKMGLRSMRALIGETAGKISGYAKRGGILGMTLLRLLPIAPYTAVNLAIGMLEVPFMVFMVGTFLGTLPGTTIGAFLGHSVLELWQEPDLKNVMAVSIGLLAWVAIIVIAHMGARWWRKNRRKTVQA